MENIAGDAMPRGNAKSDDGEQNSGLQSSQQGHRVEFSFDALFSAVEQEWQEQALCAQTDPEAFFPEKGGSTREAKRICQACSVRDECRNTHWSTTSVLVFGADFQSVNAAALRNKSANHLRGVGVRHHG